MHFVKHIKMAKYTYHNQTNCYIDTVEKQKNISLFAFCIEMQRISKRLHVLAFKVKQKELKKVNTHVLGNTLFCSNKIFA
jgi:hypothetical protein